MSEQEQMSFEQQVASAAQEAGVVDAPITETPPPAPSEAAVDADEPAAPPVAPPKAEEPPPPPQTVPLAVHIRQREKHDREVRELRQQFEVGNQRLQQLVQSLQPAPAAPPDPYTDPLGAALSKLDNLESQVSQVAQATAQEKQTQHMRQQIQEFERAVYADEQSYKTEVPDLVDAMTFAKDASFREYVALGLDANQAAARVQQDAFALASHAFQNGLSPSDLVYRVAVAKGYRKGAAPPPADGQARDGNGRFVPATGAAPPSAAEQAVEMRAAGADRAKGGGGAPENLGPLTLQQLATMDNEEFARMTSGKKWNKLMGG